MLLLDLDAKMEAVDAVHSATALYTVSPVVDALLERIKWRTNTGRLLDPCAGDGSFLVRALAQIETPPGDFESVSRVCGWELHPLAVSAARCAVEDILISRFWGAGDARIAAKSIINEGDFLTEAVIKPGEFAVIAGNPPYLRFAHLPDFFKRRYESAIEAYARGDLLHAFIDRCVDLLPENGVIAFVSADRWMFNATAANLRESLGKRVGLDHVARLDPDTSFYRPKYRRKGSPPRIHPVEIVLSRSSRKTNPITRSAISPDDGVSNVETGGRTLSDVATVRIAPWLGPVGIFVVDAATARSLGDVRMLPAVDTDDIDSATDTLRDPTRFAVVTERAVKPLGTVRKHLLSQRRNLPAKCRGKTYWMPPESITLDISKPSLLIPRIARKLRVIRLPAGVLPVNHNLQIVSCKDGLSLDALEKILASDLSQEWIRKHAPRLENGFVSITTTLLRRLPIE